MVLASHLGTRISIPAEELTCEATRQSYVAIVGNATNALVLATEVAHTALDITCLNGPLLEMLGTNGAENLIVLPGKFNHIATVALGLGDTGTCVSVVDG